MLQIRSPSHQIFATRFAPSGATTAKVPHLFNTRVWIPLNSKGAGVANELAYACEVSGGVKLAGEAWTPGQNIYWDNGNSRFTTTVGSNTLCGKALEAALSADTVTPLFAFNSFAA